MAFDDIMTDDLENPVAVGDDHDDDGPGVDADETEGEGQEATEQSSGEQPAETGSRRDRQAARRAGFKNELRAERERTAALERQMADMAAEISRSAQASRQASEAITRGTQPRTPTAVEIAEEKVLAAAARVDESDPKSGAKYLREQVRAMAELHDAMANEREERFRRTLPGPKPPHIQAILAKAPWLDPDQPEGQAHSRGVGRVVDRIAADRRVSFQTASAELREQILNQALVEYGKLTGLPVNVPTRSGGNRDGVSGARSSSFGGGERTGGNAPQITDLMRRLADADPNFKHLPQAKRYPAYAAMAAKEARLTRTG